MKTIQSKKRVIITCIIWCSFVCNSIQCHMQDMLNAGQYIGNQNENIVMQDMGFSSFVYPGKMYYEQLLHQKEERKWSIRLTLHSSVATKGFDSNSQRQPLASALFGGTVALKDVYLLAKLADNNLIRIDNSNPRIPERPQGSTDGFGSFESDQYLSLLAEAELDANAESRELGCNVCATYRFFVGDKKQTSFTFGTIIPIKNRLHVFNLNVQGGSLFTQTFIAFGVVRATPLTQFSSDFTGLLDFFERGVLAEKDIVFKGRQRGMGFGDISLFGLLDFAERFEHFNCLQMGINMVLPTGRVGSQNILFPISLGNRSLQFDFFANMIFATQARMVNPAFHVVGNIAPSYATQQRIPHVITNTIREQISVLNNLKEELLPPPSYEDYYVDPFNEFDTTVPAFANISFPVTLHRANKVTFGFGNYFYDVFSSGLQLSIFYDIMHKDGDRFKLDKKQCKQASITVSDGALDFESVYNISCERAHILSWTLNYQFKNLVMLNMGSQHVIAGKNVTREHEFFVSFIAVF